MTRYLKEICSLIPNVGQVLVSGWGLTDINKPNASPNLKHVWLDVISHDDCKQKCRDNTDLTDCKKQILDNQICTWTKGKVGFNRGKSHTLIDD